MGLLDRTNPNATFRSVLSAAAEGAAVGAVVFFVAFKVHYLEAWRVVLPIWLLLTGGVAAVCEWQVAWNDSEDDSQEE
jgi:hypothetical protein